MPPTELEPGDLVGPYRLVRMLGAGGMGVVFVAEDDALGRRVALKLIAPDRAADPDLRARFVREAQAQASLDSPHVVQVFAHGEDDGRLWIASQLVPDGDLAALLRREGPLPPAIAVDLVAQVAEGLAQAHRAGLVHRDIKPGNVLLRKRGTHLVGYLADFGLAVPAGSGEPFAGTPASTAPEVLAGGPATAASDIYSLGCLLRAVLPRRPPRALARILGRALAADPAGRHASARALCDDLRAVARTTPARPRAAPRRRLVATAAVTTAAAVALAVPGARDRPASDAAVDDGNAVRDLTTALVAGGEVDRETARCAVRAVVREQGPSGLAHAEPFAPEVRDALLAAAAGCLWRPGG